LFRNSQLRFIILTSHTSQRQRSLPWLTAPQLVLIHTYTQVLFYRNYLLTIPTLTIRWGHHIRPPKTSFWQQPSQLISTIQRCDL